MQVHQNESFIQLFDRGGGVYSNICLNACEINNCGVSLTADVGKRSKVSNVEINDCSFVNCAIGPVLIEDVVISNMKTGDLQIFWGAIFNRVRLHGKFGRLKINTSIHAPDVTDEQQNKFDENRESFYGLIDWALDISEANPLLLEINGIPSEKIIYNHDKLFVINRSIISNDFLEFVKRSSAPVDWQFMISDFNENPGTDELFLVAPTGKSKNLAKPYLEFINVLNKL